MISSTMRYGSATPTTGDETIIVVSSVVLLRFRDSSVRRMAFVKNSSKPTVVRSSVRSKLPVRTYSSQRVSSFCCVVCPGLVIIR